MSALLCHAARVEFHQQHVQPTGRSAAQAAEIAMTFHQQLQHLGVVVDAHAAQCVVAQRGDRD
ncbi:MAG: hypothetical protein WCA90_01890 [Ilumatobacteraceae bacterium]